MKTSFSKSPLNAFFNNRCQLIKQLWVSKMNALTSTLSKKKLICGLVVFSVFGESFFVYKIVQVFSEKAPVSLEIPTVSMPLPIGGSNRESISIESSISIVELDRLKTFRHYLDSLRKDAKGIQFFDSIRKKRPGLLDSLAFVENYYNINFKKQ